MKTRIHIKVGDFEFVEAEVEVDKIEDAIELYNASKTVKTSPGQGLEVKEWNQCLDRYLIENKMDSNCYQSMSAVQQNICQEIKKSFARIKAKEPVELRIRN